jgi:uncharacterized membrane protein YhiD involved in acid resistance
LGFFALTLGLLLGAGMWWWLAALVASIIAMTVSYIFFSSLRDAVALDVHSRRTQPAVDTDAVAEDSNADDSSADDSNADDSSQRL